MAFTIVITELLAKPVPLALFRLSATGFKDAGFVHFIVEFVCTLVRTQVQVLVLILHIYKFFSQLVQKRDFSLLFPPPPRIQPGYLMYFYNSCSSLQKNI